MKQEEREATTASLWQLFFTFTKIGAFTIGGGYAMIPLIEREVVTKYQWIDNEEFLDMLVLAQTAPGILAMNIAVLVGNRIRGKWGAVVSAFGSGLPSFVMILLIAIYLTQFRENEVVERAFRAIRPAVVALIATPVFRLAQSAKITWRTAWIPALTAFLIWFVGVSPILIIFLAIVSGLGYGYFKRRGGAQ